ncbi:MAG TPA: Hsp20/alpha crystallin family protein [Candidatus Polarisedimenticolia bacterium]|nr:Hsp20/alpha crystallin family protein [Candidatus Polarisedimenticolia bacterium]
MASIGPFAEISRIQSEINRLFDNLLELRSSGAEVESGGAWLPSADVYETEAALVVKFEVPGVAMKDVAMTVEGNRLILRGEKRRAGGVASKGRYHCLERGYGKFKRVVHIASPVNTREAEAILHEGVLEVTFPKVPNRRGGEVSIRVREKE